MAMGKRDKDAGRELTVGDVLDLTSSEAQETSVLDNGTERASVDDTPYLAEMIERTRQSRRPLEDILAEDLDSPAAITVRTPECLHPSEVRRAIDRTLQTRPTRPSVTPGTEWGEARVQRRDRLGGVVHEYVLAP